MESALLGHAMGVEDVQPIYESIHTQLVRKKFHQTKSIHIIIEVKAPFALSSFMTPTVDFNGNTVNDFLGKKIHFLGLNVFPHEMETHVILTWHKNSPYDQIANQLKTMTEDDKKINLSKFILAHCENIVFDMKWVDNLPSAKINLIKKIFTMTASPDPIPLNFLQDVNLFE